MRVVFEELYYSANNQKIADKKKADYQEDLEKSCADSAAWSRDSYMKDPEKKSCMKPQKLYEGYGKESSHEIYEKDMEKSHQNETDLAISYKSKKTAAVIGIGTGGRVGYSPSQLCIKEPTDIKLAIYIIAVVL